MDAKDELKAGTPSVSSPGLCGIEITKRPPKTWAQIVHGALFLVVFLSGCALVNATQLIFVVPLTLLPFPWAKEAHERGVRYTKGAFGVLISALFGLYFLALAHRQPAFACQVFAPTTLKVTFETEGTGAFTEKEAEQLVRRDASGQVVELVLPKKMVIIANHQVWYLPSLSRRTGPLLI